MQHLLDTSNGYSDLLRKVGLNPKGRNPDTLKKIIKEFDLSEDKLNINRSNLYSECAKSAHEKNKMPLEDILSNKVKNYKSSSLLRRLVSEGMKEYRCEICGISDWMGKPLSLQLDHIDGEHNNNNIDNIRILCPNCHSQTPTYAGRNIKKHKKINVKPINKKKTSTDNKHISDPPISRGDLKYKIRNMSFVDIGKEFNLSDNAIRKWCDKYNLPRRVKDIKSYSDTEWELL